MSSRRKLPILVAPISILCTVLPGSIHRPHACDSATTVMGLVSLWRRFRVYAGHAGMESCKKMLHVLSFRETRHSCMTLQSGHGLASHPAKKRTLHACVPCSATGCEPAHGTVSCSNL
jgi:hypothetical protein